MLPYSPAMRLAQALMGPQWASLGDVNKSTAPPSPYDIKQVPQDPPYTPPEPPPPRDRIELPPGMRRVTT